MCHGTPNVTVMSPRARCSLPAFTTTFLIVSMVVLASCGGSSGGTDGTSAVTDSTTEADITTTAPKSTYTITWNDCEELKCARLNVPYDYDDPEVGSFSLNIVMRPATKQKERIGSMLVNPGGPGFGGSEIAQNAAYYLSESLLDYFDIVGWDPRGTGDTTPAVDCVDNFDLYMKADGSPDDEVEKKALLAEQQAFVDECEKKSGKILPYLSTASTARDMDSIRQALGEDKITYFGFSYGSELGATWATMFPATVRAAVLDGASEPNISSVESGLRQAAGFEQQLTRFLKQCSANSTCPFNNGGDSFKAFDRLIVDLDTTPLVVTPDRVAVSQSVAYTAVSQAMYSSAMWPDLEQALADAQNDDGAGLLKLYDSYYQRKADGTFSNELEAFLAISCLDDPGPRSIEDVDSYNDAFLKAAPRIGPSFINSYQCTLWPVEQAETITITGKGAGPIMVIGTTGDAATPLESSRKMATTLEQGVFIKVTAERHTGYGVNYCVVNAADDYLINLKLPTTGLSC